MRLLKIIFLASLAVVILHFVNGHPIIGINRGTPASNEPATSPTGFTKAIEPDGADPNKVLIIGPINCPKPDGVRCTELAAALTSAGIPYARTEAVQFLPKSQLDADNLNAVMTGESPHVFIKGMAKANPTAEEVIAEYNATTRPVFTPNKVY
jgi:hypothetical protein